MSAIWSEPTGRGPVQPTAAAAVAHQPLRAGGARLTGGLLGDWQRRNREASMPLAVAQMEAAGNLNNLRLASAGEHAGYRGPAFMDSDVYKTLEAVAWELGREPDHRLADFAAEATELLEKAQKPDGYLNSWTQVTERPRYATLASSHELYCAGHLIQAAVAASRSVGSAPLLRVATRFADHLASSFLGTRDGLDGHPIVETALVELYRETGEPRYLELASQFIEQRGHGLIGDSGFGSRYLQDAVPVRQSGAMMGHAVRAVYLDCGVADVAAETGDDGLLRSSLTRWDAMVAGQMAITGGIGSRHSGEAFGDAFELPPDRAYNETCAAIASFQWSWRLLLATGDSRYADVMERVLYNGFAAAVSADGQRFFYVNPLQRRADHAENDDPGRRRAWFSCACCPPNIMRTLASLQHYVATTAADVLYLHQFGQAEISASLPAGELAVQVAADYPWSGRVELRIVRAPAAECGLAVRLPAWSAGATAQLLSADPRAAGSAVDGGEHVPVMPADRPADLAPRRSERGYLTVRRHWRPGDTLVLMLDTRPRLTYPSRRIDALRGTAAVERGPLVYCFEQADHISSIEDLAITPGAPADSGGRDGLVTVAVPALPLRLAPAGGLPYRSQPDSAEPAAPACQATAIPYFSWDNRDGGPMRVWLPVSATEGPRTTP